MSGLCEWCGKPITPETGVRLRAGKIIFLVCHEHASMAREYAKTAALGLAAMVKDGAREFVLRRFPQASKLARGFSQIGKFLTAPGGLAGE